MKEAATTLNGEARRAASILHQTPGWRWRRELCLARAGPPPRPGDACRGGNVGRMRGIVRARAGSTAGAAREKGGACGLHRQNEIHAGVDSIVSKYLADNGVAVPRDMRAAPLGSTQVAASKRVRVAPPDSIVRASALSTARNNTWTSADSPIEAGPSYRSCTASSQRRRVSRYRA